MSIHIASVSVHACTDEIVPATQGPVHAGLFYLQSLTVILNDWSRASSGGAYRGFDF